MTDDMRLAWEEPFGPLLPIKRIKTADEGVEHCNKSRLGLQGCVFTQVCWGGKWMSSGVSNGASRTEHQRGHPVE